MGVNNLPRVVARQCTDRELNAQPIDRESNAHSHYATEPPRWLGSVVAPVALWQEEFQLPKLSFQSDLQLQRLALDSLPHFRAMLYAECGCHGKLSVRSSVRASTMVWNAADIKICGAAQE